MSSLYFVLFLFSFVCFSVGFPIKRNCNFVLIARVGFRGGGGGGGGAGVSYFELS